jgi:hypothetical protein
MNQAHAYNLSAVREVIESLVYGNTNLHGRKKRLATVPIIRNIMFRSIREIVPYHCHHFT